MYKICSVCKNKKDVEEFNRTSSGKGIYGRGRTCKTCQSVKNKEYRIKNRDTILEKNKARYRTEEGKKKYLEYGRTFKEKWGDLVNIKLSIYQKSRRKKIYESRKLAAERNPVLKLKNNIKRSIQRTLLSFGSCKKSRTLDILGCTSEFFQTYIESKWESWMTWENHGKYKRGEKNYGWDLDHIIPSSSAKNEEDVLRLNHYTNFQPLCSYINRYIKRNKL